MSQTFIKSFIQRIFVLIFRWLIFASQVPSLPANFGVKKLLSGEPASPLVNDTMSMASGYSTVTGTVIGPSVITRLPIC